LRALFGDDEISYIENGDNIPDAMEIKDSGLIYESSLPNDISVILDILKDMDKNKRREVLRCVMRIEEDRDGG
jgi:hypothetical protein